MRVLITGGRQFGKTQMLYDTLDQLHIEVGIDVVIHGGARGADTMAGQWAKSRGVDVLRFPISNEDWDRYGNMAGRVRNAQMLREGKPTILVAFPGGNGTRDMRHKVDHAGLPMVRVG